MCDRVLKILDDYGYTERVVINTWSGKLHEYINKKYGKKYRLHSYYPIGCLGEISEDPYTFPYCCCMFTSNDEEHWEPMATKEEFDEMLAKGVQPWAGAGVKTEEYVDMVANGILDPVKVTRSALQNATSVASTLLTTESVVANIKEDLPAMPAGNPGMGMM